MQVALKDTLQGALEVARGFTSEWGEIHLLFLHTLNENWRQYINYLDQEVSKIVRTLPSPLLWCGLLRIS